MENKKFKESFIKSVSSYDLDLEYPYFDDEDNITFESDDTLRYLDGFPIMIDEAIMHLQKLKELGCNRVCVETDVDHIGYSFYGVKLEEIK